MIALLLPHTGAHAAQHTPLLACLPPFFRRAVAAVRRKLAVPAALDTAGAATPTTLLTAPGHDLLTDADLTALRTRKVLPRADGDIVIDERNGVHVCPWPPAGKPLFPEPEPRGPVRDTRMDVTAPHYAPDTAPEWGTAPQLEVAPELARDGAA